MNYQKLEKIELYDLIAQKTSYISSLSNLALLARKADEEAEIDAISLCDDLAKEIKEVASVMLRK